MKRRLITGYLIWIANNALLLTAIYNLEEAIRTQRSVDIIVTLVFALLWFFTGHMIAAMFCVEKTEYVKLEPNGVAVEITHKDENSEIRYEETIKRIKQCWSNDCIVLGPDFDKYGYAYFSAFREKGDDLEWYLYEDEFIHNSTANFFAAWKNPDHIVIQDIQIAGMDCNQGLGSILMNYLMKYAMDHNAKYISGSLQPVDREHFDRSEAFYKKHGFEVAFNEDRTAGRIYKKL